jgi:predicted phage-related endonuclease
MPDVSKDDRTTFIGASDTTRIAKGKGHEVWLEKTGRTPPEDLSGIFRVQLGKVTEEYTIDWTEKLFGLEIGRRQQWLQSEQYPWLTATIDGASQGSPYGGSSCCFDAKHSNAWATEQTIFDSYYWQIQQQAYVGGFEDGAIPFIAGNNWGGVVEVAIDPFAFESEMLPRLVELWQCVVDDKPYDEPKVIVAPVLDGMMTHDFTVKGSAEESKLNWALEAVGHASSLNRDKPKAELFETTKVALRGIVPDDCRSLKLPGIDVRRSKAGTLSIHFV